jgi:hypothetical protein
MSSAGVAMAAHHKFPLERRGVALLRREIIHSSSRCVAHDGPHPALDKVCGLTVCPWREHFAYSRIENFD